MGRTLRVQTITLYEPWATFIVYGWKTIETRYHDRFRSLSGRWIGIHASKRSPELYGDILMASRFMCGRDAADAWNIFQEHGYRSGEVVCVAKVGWANRLRGSEDEECHALCPTRGLFGLGLVDVRPLKQPVPVRGHQGVWHWEIDEDELRALGIGKPMAI